MRPHLTRRAKKVVLVLFCLSILCTALLAVVAAAPEAEAGCSSSECLDCLGTACESSPTLGHCRCVAEIIDNGGYCIAGGGICYIVP